MVDTTIVRPSCGGYKIIRTLGKGGNAVVKLVEKDGQNFAMKIFEPHIDDKAQFINDTQEEFNTVKTCQMPAVVRYEEFVTDAIWYKRNGTNKNVCYLTMELIDGCELIDFFNQALKMNQTITDEKELRFIWMQIADALNKLHSAGVAHRDIKPENIMITKDFTIKVIDLGYGLHLAGRRQDGFNRTYFGTETYKAPEILARKPYQGQDVDIFAYGTMLLVLSLMTYPFVDASMDDYRYQKLVQNPADFWQDHAARGKVYSEDFKSFIGLTTA